MTQSRYLPLTTLLFSLSALILLLVHRQHFLIWLATFVLIATIAALDLLIAQFESSLQRLYLHHTVRFATWMLLSLLMYHLVSRRATGRLLESTLIWIFTVAISYLAERFGHIVLWKRASERQPPRGFEVIISTPRRTDPR